MAALPVQALTFGGRAHPTKPGTGHLSTGDSPTPPRGWQACRPARLRYRLGDMKAAHAYRYGPPEQVVEIREVERPTPTGDQVLVKMHAASVNRADLDGLTPRPGFMKLFMGMRLVAVVLGGLRSVPLAFAGGLFLGIAQNLVGKLA